MIYVSEFLKTVLIVILISRGAPLEVQNGIQQDRFRQFWGQKDRLHAENEGLPKWDPTRSE